MHLRVEADLCAGLALVAHVDLRGGILADQYDGEARRTSARGQDGVDAVANLDADFGGDGLAVQNVCAHHGLVMRLLSGIIASTGAYENARVSGRGSIAEGGLTLLSARRIVPGLRFWDSFSETGV